MTTNKKFKRVARERMARTGESYTASLAALTAEAKRVVVNPLFIKQGTKAEPKRVGFWFDPKHPDSTPGLPKVETMVDTSWGTKERNIVISYLGTTVGLESIAYRGWSDCRICGESNGSCDETDGEWIWPSGFLHYIEDHNVKPPQDFIDHACAVYAAHHQSSG